MKRGEQNEFLNTVSDVLDQADQELESAITETDRYIAPVRRSILKRFPTLFLLLVTFGAASVIHGFELLLSRSEYLHARPILILFIGIGVLVATGQLYKRLDSGH